MSMQTIERHAQSYAEAIEQRREIEADLRVEVLALVRNYAQKLRVATGAESDAKLRLEAVIDANPGLFERPRTRVVHGIKVGYALGKPKVVIPDEAETIKRIRARLPEEQAELLIRVKESVHKPGLADLTAADIKRLAIAIEPGVEVIVCRPQSGPVDKLVGVLLAESETVLRAAA